MSILYAFSYSALPECNLVCIYCTLYKYASYVINIIIIFYNCVNILFICFYLHRIYWSIGKIF